jgi:hypothetical protein
MRVILMALAVGGVVAGTAAEAQYYYPPGYHDPPPPRYHRSRRYYGPPPGYYNPGDRIHPFGAPVRTRYGDPGHAAWQPRRDPRNGGLYCVQAGFTPQNGVCKPGR